LAAAIGGCEIGANAGIWDRRGELRASIFPRHPQKNKKKTPYVRLEVGKRFSGRLSGGWRKGVTVIKLEEKEGVDLC